MFPNLRTLKTRGITVQYKFSLLEIRKCCHNRSAESLLTGRWRSESGPGKVGEGSKSGDKKC
jgi:hypothetical protein